MSQGLISVTESVSISGSSSEKPAASAAPASAPSTAPVQAPKLRSCLVCRNRKVRCDKQSPCSNCSRANIACVFPSTNRPPRWARRFNRLTNNAPASSAPVPQDANPDLDKVMDRLRNLEQLVKELSGQLEQARARAAAHSTAGDSSEVNSPGSSSQNRDVEHHRDLSPATDISRVRKQFGRLVLQNASRSHYVSSAFWSRVDDELDCLETDTRGLVGDDSDSSWDEASPGKTSSTQEIERTPSERHAFLFRHNLSLSAPNLDEFHPLPSQVPFLVDVFSRNVNVFMRIVHIPTLTKMINGLGGAGRTPLRPSNEALIFSIYYAAITSMEEDDVLTNFGFSKSDLNLKYRLGLEHALAKADFLNIPDLVLIQAFALFLCLARRHDSPRFVWMMTGLVIRMAQYLGLQRDGAHLKHLTPFEIEMRRRLWWTLCRLDLRASEDQGTDLGIAKSSFDTKIPLNINDADIDPESQLMPTERYGVTDMTFARISAGIVDVMRQMMTRGPDAGVADLKDQSHLLNEIYRKFEQEYFQHASESGNIAYWVAVTVARMVMAKMTLIVFLPALFSTSSESISDEIRTKLLISAIEVAEYNHALNAEQACRHWRWLYQSHTHWHAIVYLMIEISRRPWSPIVERAWVALHSNWLIPARAPIDKDLRIWIPLRKLMCKARKHRDDEIQRLRADPQAAARLEMGDQKLPVPSSSGPFPTGFGVDIFRERWRQLVAIPAEPGDRGYVSRTPGAGLADLPTYKVPPEPPSARTIPTGTSGDLGFDMTFEPMRQGMDGQKGSQNIESTNIQDPKSSITMGAPGELVSEQTLGQSHNSFPTIPEDWADGRTMGPGFHAWLWADADPSVDVFSNWEVDSIDPSMDLGGEVNWYDWIETAKGMEWDAIPAHSAR
ncbi:uncharacterized protein Z519_08461 [Cladophialophora bantiana CBS 173.52]|uniref:Zn(2)-C6 fungal-type domain-containing protein n=1 Tax=Cladophialophora bantiana (strain ATCC 10958 / CBS 173.52 / CDC B-1940 / NIH 8579) TaxID=1442370 RepID=A0A0D2HBN6_CLAB1|nr:uncharacterized protein Z519_08461 [Cladophialophora bantiana CBS 173.52]KIW90678.1 hypothetical protein Z519_08461 [Cladophialophora bantiana CBS 173.52]